MGGIRIVQLEKKFGGRKVLDHFSLDVPAGCFLSLLGKSGAGKTTLIRSVAGLCPIDGGTIRIGDRDVAGSGRDIPPDQRGVGIVFQDLALWPHMRVWENVAFPLEGTLSRRDRRRRAIEALVEVRLEDRQDSYPHEISGGEQRRVALARALVGEPEVLLLDEPFSDLESSLREELMDRVRELASRRGVAAIHATHIQEEALAFADRLAVLHDGRILQQGDPEEVYARPQTPLVARLLGDYNLLCGERVGPNTVATPLGEWNVPEGEDEILIGIRPEALQIDGVGDFEAKILRRRFLGGRTLYQVDVRGEFLWVTGRGGLRIGETVRLAVDRNGAQTFSGVDDA
ncbi:MAG: ABC transporter ATP-binding protein [Planctomycetota bacterium]|nr:ABC transporter ATP-binding protein [Planctomycetota bacterium]